MGTNYYAKEEICECCGHSEKVVHIGKSSCGWTFTFHALDDIRSEKEWCMFLSQKDVRIFDEYDRKISYIEFTELVNLKRKESHNHAKECGSDPYDHSFLDDRGNSFSEGDFS